MQEIVLATNNAHKIGEMKQILCDYPFSWRSLAEFPPQPEPIEDGSTYLANALIKARAACADTGLPSLADDSGLEVLALGGIPGIHSARYGGKGSTQAQKIELLLKEIEASGSPSREAVFRCVIALVLPDGREWSSEASCEGLIAEQSCGDHGFGYDPVFWLRDYQKTMAQLSEATKNRISHRAVALFDLMQTLGKELSSYPQL